MFLVLQTVTVWYTTKAQMTCWFNQSALQLTQLLYNHHMAVLERKEFQIPVVWNVGCLQSPRDEWIWIPAPIHRQLKKGKKRLWLLPWHLSKWGEKKLICKTLGANIKNSTSQMWFFFFFKKAQVWMQTPDWKKKTLCRTKRAANGSGSHCSL